MPYIDQLSRMEIYRGQRKPTGPGELNYAITCLIQSYLYEVEAALGRVAYQDYNEVIGVLESAKLELYRRMVAPYEDTKLEENGDVY